MGFYVANILTSLTFLKRLELSAVNIVVLSDGAQYYKHHENIKTRYSLEVRINGWNNTVC